MAFFLTSGQPINTRRLQTRALSVLQIDMQLIAWRLANMGFHCIGNTALAIVSFVS